jgi:oligopeptide transport system permease protein
MATVAATLRARAVQEPKRKPTSLWRDAMRRLRKNKAAMVALGIIGMFALIAVFAKQLAPYTALDVPEPGNTLRQAAWVRTGDPATTGTWKYPLGTDSIGHDVLSQVIWGARTSMVVGFIPMILIVFFGTTIGMLSGFFGGKVDTFLMRLTDVVYAFPDLLFFIIVVTALRDTTLGQLMNGLLLLFAALSMVNWVGVARIVRGQVLSLKEKEFVEAARMIGAGKLHIMFKHLLPNTLAPIVVLAAFLIPGAILTEATLGFLGLGLRPASDAGAFFQTSWGMLLLWGRDAMRSQPWLLIAPAVCIAVIMLSFTFLGDGLRDALDPSMKGAK